MKNGHGESSLTLVTLATLVMGLDYALGLFFPGLGAVVSLNRVLFLGFFELVIYEIGIRLYLKMNGDISI